ncbi:MAG TPA: M48 family metalloprotease [Kofleriaceae bacterium]|nr:M48 family metalloprotease [Kofleriaceae bacterium]
MPLMLRSSPSIALLSLALAACGPDSSTDDPHCTGGKCDDAGEPDACEAEGRYGDGTCDGTCALPDTDCFLFFDDHAAADDWFTGFEATLAASESRPPRSLIPPSDPRYMRMRELLDRGWASYAEHRPVGQLDRAPELVVIDDPAVNAFVAFDRPSGTIGWTVMVQSGLIELDASEPAILGVVMHELTHAVDRHVLPGAGDRIRIHYQLEPGEAEPLGFAQDDEPLARAAISAWRKLGEEAGPYPVAELHGIPTGSDSLMTKAMNAVLQAAVAHDQAACALAIDRVGALSGFLGQRISPLDGLLRPLDDGERAELDRLSSDFLAAFRAPCLTGSSLDLFPLIAELFGVTVEEVLAEFDPADQALIEGRPILDQITLLTEDRYRRMREVEAMLMADTGGDTTSLRYYSTEEAADDSTVPVLAGMGLPPDGVGDFFITLVPAEGQAECAERLGRDEVPPYGDLIDEHHASCWRAYHVGAVAEQRENGTASARRRSHPGAAAAYQRTAGPRLPRFWRPSDDTSSALHR